VKLPGNDCMDDWRVTVFVLGVNVSAAGKQCCNRARITRTNSMME
jgi:hypothetical protein